MAVLGSRMTPDSPPLSAAVLKALEALRDLQAPQWGATQSAPEAPTWPLLLLLSALLALGLVSYVLWRRSPRAIALRRIRELRRAYQHQHDPISLVAGLSGLLREFAQGIKGGGGPSFTPGLAGDQWLEFLAAHGPIDDRDTFRSGVGRLLIDLPFRSSETGAARPDELTELTALSERWLMSRVRRQAK